MFFISFLICQERRLDSIIFNVSFNPENLQFQLGWEGALEGELGMRRGAGYGKGGLVRQGRGESGKLTLRQWVG